jgi:hypothetical protein
MREEERGRRGGWIGRTALVYLLFALVAFAIGSSGLPGQALAAIAEWLTDGGHVHLVGPVGEVVRLAL